MDRLTQVIKEMIELSKRVEEDLNASSEDVFVIFILTSCRAPKCDTSSLLCNVCWRCELPGSGHMHTFPSMQ